MKHKLNKVYAPYYQSPKQFEGYFKNLHLMARLKKIVYGKHWIFLKSEYLFSYASTNKCNYPEIINLTDLN